MIIPHSLSFLFLLPVFPLKQIRIPVTPLYHGVDNRDKGLSQWRNGIFGTWRQFGKDGFGHQAVLHQLLQLNVQYTGSSLGEKFVKLTGAQRTMTQFVQNTRFPFGVYQTHGQA